MKMGKNLQNSKYSFAVVIVVVILLIGLIIWSVGRFGSSQNEMKKLLEQGQNGFLDMDYEKAVAIFDAYLKKNSEDEEVRRKIEEFFLAWTEWEEKDGNLNRALEIATKGFDMLQSDTLKKEMERLEGLADESVESTMQVGDAGEISTANTSKDKRESESEPELSEQNKLRMMYEEHLRTDDPADAVSFYQSQVELNPSEPIVYEFGAAAYLLQDDVIQALSVLETGISNGADKALFEEKEDYIRENAVILYSSVTTTETDYDGNVTNGWEKITYDEKGREPKRESSNGTTTQYEYDDTGNITGSSYQHPGGKDVYHHVYNDYGDEIYEKYESEYRGKSSVVEYSYEYEYNDNGQAVHRKESRDGAFLGNEEYYEYDGQGNRIRIQFILNGSQSYEEIFSYDEEGRVLTDETVGDIPQPTSASYEYDARGNMVVANEWYGSSYFTYDIMDYPLEVRYSGIQDEGANYSNTYHFIGDAYQLLKE